MRSSNAPFQISYVNIQVNLSKKVLIMLCDHECSDCKEKAEAHEMCQHYMQEVMTILFSDGEIDFENLDYSLNTICTYLDVKWPTDQNGYKELRIRR